ncbi:MAG TPA: MFS transporter [Nocardioidaceae bacterium]|nr:MFS transporter [Nocardioidaceae bacterium]
MGYDEAGRLDDETATDPAPPSHGGRSRTFARAAGTAARSTGRGTRRAAGLSGRAARKVGAATGRAAGFTVRQARRATHAEGAGDSGLSRLIELHAFNAAGDTAVAVSLAGTLFFQAPTGEARDQVALFLGLTMLPFAIVAPLIGPFLDRFSHGRRWAIGATMALRAFLCWVLATAVLTESFALFPAALGCLVASKAYGVTRASAVPRLLPSRLTLVKANSRISLAGVAGGAVSAPLAVLASTFGAQWSLRYAFLVFVGGTILAILLPSRVDSSQGEERLALTSVGGGTPNRRAWVPASVVFALRGNAALRLLSGFLTMFLAFLLRDQPFPGWEDRPELLLGVVIGAAGLGSTIGIGLGSVLKAVKPEVTIVVVLLADAAMAVVVAVFYGLVTAALLGLTAGLAQSLGKLSLDALIQHEVPERTRTSAFARSETLLQLSWVVGGFIGIVMPLIPQVGLGVAATILVAWSGWVLATARARRPAP